MPLTDPNQRELAARLARYALDDPGADYTFSARLARENAWIDAYAARVIEEYKRFVLLALCAGHPVTPSEAVDQVWHMHLTYTTAYWLDFCPHVLGKPLHHDPTRGGSQERSKHGTWYENTLASYRRLFDAEPPPDIWPSVQERFVFDYVRVRRCEHWVVRRPHSWTRWRASAAASKRALRSAQLLGAAAAVPSGSGCAGEGGGESWLALFIVASVGGLLYALTRNGGGGGSSRSGGCGGGGCGGGGDGGCGGCGGS